jgi:ribosomal protein S27AE
MYLLDRCPGSANQDPTLSMRRCPECGGEVEIFSNDTKVECVRCGFVIYNDTASCIQWCKHARNAWARNNTKAGREAKA